MRYAKPEQLTAIANVSEQLNVPRLSKVERLNRWADLLESEAGRRLNTLRGTEYLPEEELEVMRMNGSPITVALEDPMLRVEGLTSDRYGAAKAFFDLTDGELHNVLCYCHFGATVRADRAAAAIRRIVRTSEGKGLRGWLRRVL